MRTTTCGLVLGLMAAAMGALAQDARPTPAVVTGVGVTRVEFWARRTVPVGASAGESVLSRFLVWDTADAGFHPDKYDVAVTVANETGEVKENVRVVLRERRLLGPVLRLEHGEFAGLLDRAGSLAASTWTRLPDQPGLTYEIRRMDPGARKKIIFHDISLGMVAAELRAARPFCWKVEYVAELELDGARGVGSCSGVLDVALED